MIASIPSPAEGVWYLGPVPLRAYALAIMLGIVVAVWLGERRWVARGGRPGDVLDIAIWAVVFGMVGARAYHVVTDWDRYFGSAGDPVDALRIWAGGLSIFGAIAAGALGGYLAARQKGIPFPPLADALAPGVVLAQAIGRWGNYFNQELFGRPTDLPWALEIDENHRPVGFEQFATFHPTFLYESLWAAAVAVILILADRKFRMGHGRVFALYVALYAAGRIAVEQLRIDTGGVVEGPARELLGMRINAWVSTLLLVGAVMYIVISALRKPGRETVELPPLEGSETLATSDDEATADADAAVEATAIERAWAAKRAGEAAEGKEGSGSDPDSIAEQPDGERADGERPDVDQSTEASATAVEVSGSDEASATAVEASEADEASADEPAADEDRDEARAAQPSDRDLAAEEKVDADRDVDADHDTEAERTHPADPPPVADSMDDAEAAEAADAEDDQADPAEADDVVGATEDEGAAKAGESQR